MNELLLYRKRIIPEECILLKGDTIVSADEEKIITKWSTIHPRSDFSHGSSCYFLKRGFKVSKFYKEDGSLLYWYCDIVEYSRNEAENSLTVTDLLADVIVYPNGSFKVLDLDELAEAFSKKLITDEQMTACLCRLHDLLDTIYRDRFDRLQSCLDTINL